MITVTKYGRKGCRPCLILSNYLNEIDFDAHKAKLVERDTDEMTEEEITRAKIGGLPTITFSRNGVEITRFTGLRGTDEIIDAINVAKEAR